MATASAGRKSRPATLKLVEGRSEGKDSGGRAVKQPPAFVRLPPEKPEGLSDDAAWLWDRIVAELPRVQLLKELDGPALEIGCETYSRWRAARNMRVTDGLLQFTSQGQGVAPWIRIEEQASKDFRAWCAEFGLTPAAEMKVAKSEAAGDGEEDPFA